MGGSVQRWRRFLLVGGLTVAGLGGSDRVASATPESARVAAEAGRSEAEVRRILADPTARVGPGGHIYYVEPHATTPAAEVVPPASEDPLPLDQTFLLHSRPASNRVIYLDFDGQTVTGSLWNGPSPSFDVGPFSLPPYESPAFSAAEKEVIHSVWQRVSEDFAVFGVDVTTEDPGYAAINRSGVEDEQFGTRVLITNTKPFECGCGGMAAFANFDDPFNHDFLQPGSFAFTLSAISGRTIAAVVSHEAGHNLGLDHDGTDSAEYYSGHGAWAPIMGHSAQRAVTQWSKGEYADADNTEDDFAVMADHGAPALPDDHGDLPATATRLASDGSVAASGIITTDADVDVFRVRAGAGPASFAISPSPVGPNLDLKLELRSAGGDLAASDDPPSEVVDFYAASGLDASVSTDLVSPGTYFLFVSGVGTADELTGYSGYGSVGRYTLSGSVEPPSGRYVLAGRDGSLFAPDEGGPLETTPVRPGTNALEAAVAGVASTPTGQGHWLAQTDGGVITIGDAPYLGDVRGLPLQSPIVGITATEDGKGLYLAAADGGVFALGGATFKGSLGGGPLNQPIVGIDLDSDGAGYVLAAADGGVFTFEAAFRGSLGSSKLNKPVSGIAVDVDGYVLAGADGGVFAFGAPFAGSLGSIDLAGPVVGIASDPDGRGYWLAGADGGVFAFDARFHGSAAAVGSRISAITAH